AALPSSRRLETLSETLKHLGAWLTQNLPDVVAIEWVDDGDAFWVVQCDDETDAPDAIDPSSLEFPVTPRTSGKTTNVGPFVLYSAGGPTLVRKLLLLNDFETTNYHTKCSILHTTELALRIILADKNGKSELAKQIDQYGPQGIVVRTEITAQGSEALPNLPRTD